MNRTLRSFLISIQSLTGAVISRRNGLGEALERVELVKLFRHSAVDCVFDVGANEGQYVRQLRSDMKFRGKIISFEPIPSLARALRCRAKRDPFWYVQELALDDTSGPANFSIASQKTFSSLLNPLQGTPFGNAAMPVDKIHVTKARLDEIYSDLQETINFQRPFLKMDTQGNDLAVAKGAGAFIQCFVGIQTELSFQRSYENSASFSETIDFFRTHGFELSSIVHNHPWQFPDLVEADALFYKR